MENNLENFVVALTTSVFSEEILFEIANIIQEINCADLSKFISANIKPLHTLEHWAWTMLCGSTCQWINQAAYLELFKNLAVFNTNLIFISNDIDADTKGSLLIPETTDISKKIFEQLEQIENENDLYFLFITLWYDNLSYLCQEHTRFIKSPIIIDINHMISTKFVMTDQYKSYLTQLQQTTLTYTNKQMFYLKTCSFSLSSFLFCKKQVFPFTGEEILNFLGNDYIEIVRLHSPNVQSWSKELLCSITHLINFIHTCYWWRGDTQTHIKILLPTEDISHHHMKSLVHIISHASLQQRIESHRFNDETILIDTITCFITYIVQETDLTCFVRHRTHLLGILLPLAETPRNDLINLRAYALFGALSCEEYLKELKIADHVCDYYFHVLKLAWNDPMHMYQRVCVHGLLRSFLNLAKNDSVQQAAADAHKISLLIEMCDQYPVVYDILWALSFNHDIQQQLRSNPKFMYNISHLKQDVNNEQMRKITHGILWNLEQTHEDHKVTDNDMDMDKEPMFDIMISYSHKDKVLCKKIYDELIKAGYRVWIDFDQMHGNVMDAMAHAIEHSRMVLICMSEPYRRSNYCRAEAYYAFQRQLKIVPVLLQEHYRPDGWLLFLVGQLLYVDFTKYEFSKALGMLFKELGACSVEEKPGARCETIHEVEPLASNLPIPLPLPGSVSQVRVRYMIDWNQGQVQEWLIENNLMQMSRLLLDHDGASLICLNRYLVNGEAGEIIKLLGEDCIRRIHQSLSLLELSRLQTLVDKEQKEHPPPTKHIRNVIKRKHRISLDSCKIM